MQVNLYFIKQQKNKTAWVFSAWPLFGFRKTQQAASLGGIFQYRAATASCLPQRFLRPEFFDRQ